MWEREKKFEIKTKPKKNPKSLASDKMLHATRWIPSRVTKRQWRDIKTRERERVPKVTLTLRNL